MRIGAVGGRARAGKLMVGEVVGFEDGPVGGGGWCMVDLVVDFKEGGGRQGARLSLASEL